MYGYRAPLRDMRFVLHELLGAKPLTELPGCEEATPELIDGVLEEAAKLAERELAPLAASRSSRPWTSSPSSRSSPGFSSDGPCATW